MVIIVRKDCNPKQLSHLITWIKGFGVEIHESTGDQSIVLGLVGDTKSIDIDLIESLDIVESAKRIQEPYKSANRKFHPEDTIVDAGGHKIGGGHFQVFAGPCSVESEEQIIAVAKAVKASGANILRGGAFKPRTSPYAFQGMKDAGIKLLLEAKQETGMPICTELMNIKDIPVFDDIDIIQIGARNMQNFDLLKEVGKMKKTVLLKRGLANTIEEWLMSAEYIMSEGTNDIIMCERGIRTFETKTRNTLDVSAVPVLKELSHFPVIIDPSHATGVARYVEPMSMSAIGAGADGLMIEVHNDPIHALCDGAQSLRPEVFDTMMKKFGKMLEVVGKKID